jgi:Kef-type K+ transport system membrane component KefB
LTESQLAPILVSLTVILASAHLLGYVAAKLRQPRFVGEILAGVLIGPFVLGEIAPDATTALLGDGGDSADPTRLVLAFLSWLGLLLLMFISGSEVRRVLAREQRGPTAWILGLGTVVPFAIAFAVGAALPTEDLRGPRGGEIAFLLVLATAAAVTSIPVISRIFHDLGILHTRFASLILGTAMLEDIALFATLAVATTLARPGAEMAVGELVSHLTLTTAYLLAGLLIAPKLLRAVVHRRWNVLARRQPIGYALVMMLAYTSVAAALDANVVFGAFLAGFGLVGGIQGTQREWFASALDAIGKFAFASFVPIYFALVGTRLELGAGFSIVVLLVFLVGSSALRGSFVGLAGRASGFGGRDATDVAVAMNARGGPGIVLATVAFEAGIIAPQFFTALVITAIVTSQFAGWWLGRALRRRGELLGERIGDAAPTPRVGATGPEPELVATVDVTAPQDTSVGTAATSGGRT